MTFLFPCFRQLKRQLGELDAVCECIELAVRELVTQEEAMLDGKLFVSQLSEKHGVRVNRMDAPLLRGHAVHLYLVSVHQGLEDFLLALKREHPSSSSWNMAGDDDRLTRTARAVGLAPTLAFDLCQHYREVRNAFVHSGARASLRDRDDLRGRVASDTSLASLKAPSTFSSVSFDDFVLFTRSVKAVAKELCEAARPCDATLTKLAVSHARKTGLQGRLAQNPSRLARAMSSFLQTTYSMTRAEADRIAEGSLA